MGNDVKLMNVKWQCHCTAKSHCSKFQTFVLAHFNTTILTFTGGHAESGQDHVACEMASKNSPAISQNTASSDKFSFIMRS